MQKVRIVPVCHVTLRGLVSAQGGVTVRPQCFDKTGAMDRNQKKISQLSGSDLNVMKYEWHLLFYSL